MNNVDMSNAGEGDAGSVEAETAQSAATTLRYEIKLVCDPHRLPQALSWIRMHPAGLVATYPPRRVNSLYLDTPDLSSLNDNLAGISARRKLRLRWYGEGAQGIRALLELKEKRNMLTRKRQTWLPCRLDLARPWAETLRAVRAGVGPAWQVLLQAAHQPTLLNHYRRAYYATRNGLVRVTLDSAQVAYDQRLSLRPNLRLRLPIADTVVIEIKSSPEQAGRLQEIVASFPVRRSRNSKYASGLRTALG